MAAIDLDTGEVLAVHVTTTRAFVDRLAVPLEGGAVLFEQAARER